MQVHHALRRQIAFFKKNGGRKEKSEIGEEGKKVEGGEKRRTQLFLSKKMT